MHRLVDDDHPMLEGITRVMGFAALAEATAATGHAMVPSTVRGYYLKDLARGRWQLLPRPDVVLLRTPGNPLPGWSQDTIGVWLPARRA
jgi:hypothetical protein